MSVSLIPESAPFDAVQRAWLNGFLAGWLGVSGKAGECSSAGAGTALLDASSISRGKGSVAPSASPEATEQAEDFPWHDPALPIDDRLTLAEGKPVERRLMAAMAQLDCGSCGYDCRRYAEAIARGEEKNLSLCSPGGRETSKALKRIAKERVGEGAPSAGSAVNGHTSNGTATNGHAANALHVQASPIPATPAAFDRHRPYRAKVARILSLNGEGSAKRTSHVEISLAGSGIVYEPGDALGVWPKNCDELVRAVAAAAGIDREAPVTLASGETLTAIDALTRRCDLKIASEGLVELTIASTRDAAAKESLRSLLQDDEALDEHDVLDVLLAAPRPALDAQAFVASLSPLTPRLYSIASSLAAHPEQVHLTIGRVAMEVRGRLRKGVASTMFADRLWEGDGVDVFVQRAHGFALPADPATPVIMVGPGTGIAPFRSFLSHREATGAAGKNWLFFGDQKKECDFLYQSEVAGWLDRGTLTRLDLAFSRDQSQKVYVQDRMRENGGELFRWIAQGACFYVCGDASRMARDVDQALREAIAEEGGLSAEEAKNYVSRLAAAGRYCRDVY
ncbi:MAG TPA: sulfite reductase subunit alpha [Pirellulaceae bacterium]|jgi:sulfite reductase (NADPH) flavoprotein alpha-component|nr:sulfite reductase subunit alpha [Pirellulaceae bacterium]